jgi:hypothetical protein
MRRCGYGGDLKKGWHPSLQASVARNRITDCRTLIIPAARQMRKPPSSKNRQHDRRDNVSVGGLRGGAVAPSREQHAPRMRADGRFEWRSEIDCHVADHRGDSPIVIKYMLALGNAVQTAVSARCGIEAKRLGGSRSASSRSLLIIAGAGTGKDEYTRLSANALDPDRYGAVVHLAADFHPSRRRRGKSGKDSRVGASRPFGSAAWV